MTICHMLDTLRCIKQPDYQAIMLQVAGIVGESNKDKLVQLAHLCVAKTGDRVMALEPQQFYLGKLFVDSSQNIEACADNIRAAVKQWEIGLNANQLH